MIDALMIFLGIIRCYECNGKSGARAHRTKGGAVICAPCRDALLTKWSRMARGDTLERYVPYE